MFVPISPPVWMVKIAKKRKALFHTIPWKGLSFVYFPEY
jgi:hypothetical protein